MIKLTTYNNHTIYINPTHIIAISLDGKVSHLYLSDKEHWEVLETPEEIVELIEEADPYNKIVDLLKEILMYDDEDDEDTDTWMTKEAW